MKPEEMAKTTRRTAEEKILSLIKSKPHDVFDVVSLRSELGLGGDTIRHALVEMPQENKIIVIQDGHKTNVIGSSKAIAKFKSLLP